MKEQYYLKRIKECLASAQDYELKAEKEMKDGSGAQATEYCRLADMKKINARNYQEAIECLSSASEA
jgi:hypothetical protein